MIFLNSTSSPQTQTTSLSWLKVSLSITALCRLTSGRHCSNKKLDKTNFGEVMTLRRRSGLPSAKRILISWRMGRLRARVCCWDLRTGRSTMTPRYQTSSDWSHQLGSGVQPGGDLHGQAGPHRLPAVAVHLRQRTLRGYGGEV